MDRMRPERLAKIDLRHIGEWDDMQLYGVACELRHGMEADREYIAELEARMERMEQSYSDGIVYPYFKALELEGAFDESDRVG